MRTTSDGSMPVLGASTLPATGNGTMGSATIVYCDNVSVAYMTANPVHHLHTKHIEIHIHFIRNKVALGQVRVLHVPLTCRFSDIMPKGLLPAATSGGY
jgi:hypothetical protein